jgi:hypothetical protein
MNKMFKKIMAVSATVAIAATMSVSAFAADVTVAPTDNAVTVTPTAVENATMYTVMVFSCAADADIAKATPADATAIYYINQGADVNALVSNMLVKATSETEYLPAGNYVVRIGNDKGSVQNFALESKVEETTKTYTITCKVDDAYAEVYMDGALGTKVDGGYTFTKENGTYTLVVKAPGAFTKTIGNVVVADANTEVTATLAYGSVREDATEIALEDLSILLGMYGHEANAEGSSYNVACDFDRNGTVELTDLSILLGNYGKTLDNVYAE